MRALHFYLLRRMNFSFSSKTVNHKKVKKQKIIFCGLLTGYKETNAVVILIICMVMKTIQKEFKRISNISHNRERFASAFRTKEHNMVKKVEIFS